MIPDLAPAFDGPLSFARDSLVLPDDARPAIPCSALRCPVMLGTVMDRFAARFPGGDRHAVASMWSQYYLARLIYPVLAVNLLLDRALPVGLEETSLILTEDGAPDAFRIAHCGRPVAEEGCARYAALVRGHLEPMVAAMAEAGGASPRLFWCNAGHRCDHLLSLLEGRAETAPAAEVLLGLPRWEEAWDNPLGRSLCAAPEGGSCSSRRRVCCLRYRLPGFEDGCPSCPLPAIRRKHDA